MGNKETIPTREATISPPKSMKSLDELPIGVHTINEEHLGFMYFEACRRKQTPKELAAGKEPRLYGRCLGEIYVPAGTQVVVSGDPKIPNYKNEHIRLSRMRVGRIWGIDWPKSETFNPETECSSGILPMSDILPTTIQSGHTYGSAWLDEDTTRHVYYRGLYCYPTAISAIMAAKPRIYAD
jgi:hypothetical protein